MEDFTQIYVKDIEHFSFLEMCQGVERQQQLLALRSASLDELRIHFPDADVAKKVWKALKNAKEGYLRITRQYPSLDTPKDGWTYAFAEGISLWLDRFDEWYSTSIIQRIAWEVHTFTTMNSIYSFEIIENVESWLKHHTRI